MWLECNLQLVSLARRITSFSSVKVWMTLSRLRYVSNFPSPRKEATDTTGPKTSSLLIKESSGIPVKIVGVKNDPFVRSPPCSSLPSALPISIYLATASP